ncbi:hypothetical protein ANTQUA_LOCUS2980 [Anthophora quadrimaculata]
MGSAISCTFTVGTPKEIESFVVFTTRIRALPWAEFISESNTSTPVDIKSPYHNQPPYRHPSPITISAPTTQLLIS